jgi:transcription antitermination factor NusG
MTTNKTTTQEGNISMWLTPRYPAAFDSMAFWCVMRTEPQRERMAATALHGHRVEVFLPEFQRKKLCGRKMRLEWPALFPGYFFAKLPPSGKIWDRIRTVGGMLDKHPVLLNGDGPYKMEFGVIRLIAEFENDLASPRLRPPKFQIGQTVRFREGPFEGLFAGVETMDDRGRVTVLMSLLGQATSIKVDEAAIEAA